MWEGFGKFALFTLPYEEVDVAVGLEGLVEVGVDVGPEEFAEVGVAVGLEEFDEVGLLEPPQAKGKRPTVKRSRSKKRLFDNNDFMEQISEAFKWLMVKPLPVFMISGNCPISF